MEQFSNGAILKWSDSQMEQFSNGAIWGRHHQLDDSLVGQLTSDGVDLDCYDYWSTCSAKKSSNFLIVCHRENSKSSWIPLCLHTQSPSPPTVLSPTSTSGRVSSQAQELLSLFRALRTFRERMRGNTWNTASSSVTLATLSLSLLRLPSMVWTSVVVLLGV